MSATALQTPAASMPPLTRSRGGGRSPASPGASGQARLTRRGRAVVLVVLTLVVLALASVGRVWASASSEAPSAPVTQTWVVQPGETLWDVAASVEPGVDPRDTVARIVDLNGLSGSGVVVGQQLLVPAGG